MCTNHLLSLLIGPISNTFNPIYVGDMEGANHQSQMCVRRVIPFAAIMFSLYIIVHYGHSAIFALSLPFLFIPSLSLSLTSLIYIPYF